MKKYEDWMATDDWRRDYNKAKTIEKKHKAGSAVSLAMAEPTLENVKMAFGLLNDFVKSLTTLSKEPEKELESYRKALNEIAKILHGDPKNQEIKKLYLKYSVKRIVKKEGIFVRNHFVNLFNIAEKLDEIYTKANYLAQKLGYGSAMPIERPSALERI